MFVGFVTEGKENDIRIRLLLRLNIFLQAESVQDLACS